MIQKQVKVCNRLGIMARASSDIIRVVQKYETTQVYLCSEDRRSNTRSIMDLMMLAAVEDTVLIIEANGPDEEKVVNELQVLIEETFPANDRY